MPKLSLLCRIIAFLLLFQQTGNCSYLAGVSVSQALVGQNFKMEVDIGDSYSVAGFPFYVDFYPSWMPGPIYTSGEISGGGVQTCEIAPGPPRPGIYSIRVVVHYPTVFLFSYVYAKESRTVTFRAEYPPASYSLSATNANFESYFDGGSFDVQSSRPWRIVNTNAWIRIRTGALYSYGTARVGYTVAANHSATPRAGNLRIGDQLYSISQEGATWHAVGISDLNSDGHPDIVFHHDDGLVAANLMEGTNLLSSIPIGKPVAKGWRLVTLGDLNGDWQNDALWQHDTGYVSVTFMHGTNRSGFFPINLDHGVSRYPLRRLKAAGDFNANLHADLFFENILGARDCWSMDGTRYLGEISLENLPLTGLVGLGDFNGDTGPDFFYYDPNTLDQALTVCLNGFLQPGVERYQTLPSPPTHDWKFVGLADFDQDGTQDILWRTLDGHVVLWLIEGNNIRETVTLL